MEYLVCCHEAIHSRADLIKFRVIRVDVGNLHVDQILDELSRCPVRLGQESNTFTPNPLSQLAESRQLLEHVHNTLFRPHPNIAEREQQKRE